MKKALVLVTGLLCASAASAADLKILMGSTVSTYSSRWPVYYTEYSYERSGLNPFKNYKAGGTFGLGLVLPIARKFSLEVDAYYANRGADLKMWYIESGVDGYEEYYDLKGVTVPILIKAALLPRPFPYFLVGGDVTFILTHRRESFLLYQYGTDEQWYGSESSDFDPSTRKWDFGPVLGLGMEIPLQRGAFFVEARYTLGLANLYRGTANAKVMTRTFLIVAGFRVGASK